MHKQALKFQSRQDHELCMQNVKVVVIRVKSVGEEDVHRKDDVCQLVMVEAATGFDRVSFLLFDANMRNLEFVSLYHCELGSSIIPFGCITYPVMLAIGFVSIRIVQ